MRDDGLGIVYEQYCHCDMFSLSTKYIIIIIIINTQ